MFARFWLRHPIALTPPGPATTFVDPLLILGSAALVSVAMRLPVWLLAPFRQVIEHSLAANVGLYVAQIMAVAFVASRRRFWLDREQATVYSRFYAWPCAPAWAQRLGSFRRILVHTPRISSRQPATLLLFEDGNQQWQYMSRCPPRRLHQLAQNIAVQLRCEAISTYGEPLMTLRSWYRKFQALHLVVRPRNVQCRMRCTNSYLIIDRGLWLRSRLVTLCLLLNMGLLIALWANEIVRNRSGFFYIVHHFPYELAWTFICCAFAIGLLLHMQCYRTLYVAPGRYLALGMQVFMREDLLDLTIEDNRQIRIAGPLGDATFGLGLSPEELTFIHAVVANTLLERPLAQS